MGQITYRANLSAAFFPFLSILQGRTVIVPGPDNNFNRQLQSAADTDKDVGIPQMYYCHNVVPNGNGYQSVGYDQHIATIDGTDKAITQMLYLTHDGLGKRSYFAVAPTGFYWCETEGGGWSAIITQYYDTVLLAYVAFPALTGKEITVAHVNGVSYFYIENVGMFYWHFGLFEFQTAKPTSIVEADVVGITESNGYMIAYTANAVAWSSLLSPTDFVPSLITGAGGGNVESIKGAITCGAPTSNGFILYTSLNAVAVLYTGNTQYPFQFSECIGAGGVTSLERVSYDSDSGYNYAYTSNGFQIMRSKNAETVFADITDFLAGQYIEDFDESTRVFSQQTLSTPLLKKLTFVANRYLIISYGIFELTHAILYDTVQKRFGKLKFTHVDCFQYDLLDETVSDTPRKSIGFLDVTGKVSVVNFVLSNTDRNGVILLGKYQYVRARHMQLQRAEIEGPAIGSSFSIYDMVSSDGKNFSQTIAGTAILTGNNIGIYGFGSPDGLNHSLLCMGAWNFTSVVLEFNITGRM